MPAPNPYAPPADGGPAHDPRRDATWALVLGIGSVVFCAPITAPLAVWRGARALRSGASAQALAGIGFAAFGLLTSALFWFLAIWQFLSPGPPSPSP